MSLQKLPEQEKPRERLLQRGAHQLSNAELLAIVMATSGQRGTSVIDLAHRLLNKAGDLNKLVHMGFAELRTIKGIGPVKAGLILAVVELSRRLNLEGAAPTAINSPSDVQRVLAERFRYEERERFYAVLLNTKNHFLGLEEISVGSLNSSIVHPREVFRPAIRQSAAAVIVAHNHPSGDPTPSREDIEVTRRLIEAGKIVGIEVLDHIIFGKEVILSLRDKGLA